MNTTSNFIAPVVALRHTLHACAELSGSESDTAGLIYNFLKKCNPTELRTNIGGAGLLAIFDSGNAGPVILFRSELDALPIEEKNEISYRSAREGVSHKCGHDGHMAILCGLAERLANEPPINGKVLLLFQPSEETGEGAQRICDDPHFDIVPDYVFALHNIPGEPTGQVIVKDGTFSAAVNSMIICLEGKETHAAQPESGINPSNAVAEISIFCNELNNNDPASPAFRLITPVHIKMGAPAYGTAAGYAEIHYTLRSWDNDGLRRMEKIIEEAVKNISAKNYLQQQVNYTQSFFANRNNPEANDLVRNAASLNGIDVNEKQTPFKWGEDFGFFTSFYKGCMFGLGAGEDHADLHNPDYDFPDEIIANGIAMFYSISKLVLNKNV